MKSNIVASSIVVGFLDCKLGSYDFLAAIDLTTPKLPPMSHLAMDLHSDT
jgi:hypothetical protein